MDFGEERASFERLMNADEGGTSMLNRLFKAMAMLQEGIACRNCGEGVGRHDHFGLSESICANCRA